MERTRWASGFIGRQKDIRARREAGAAERKKFVPQYKVFNPMPTEVSLSPHELQRQYGEYL